jgi:hypothetical protein
MNMSVKDGNVLVANIFLSDNVLIEPVRSIEGWRGIRSKSDIASTYAKHLFDMSSIIPETYRSAIVEEGYNLAPGARMLFPGIYPELIGLGFALSGATPTA